MVKGFIELPADERTEKEKADERWSCYLKLRDSFPETMGSVDLEKFDLDKYFEELEDAQERG